MTTYQYLLIQSKNISMHFPAVTMTTPTLLEHMVRKANMTSIACNSYHHFLNQKMHYKIMFIRVMQQRSMLVKWTSYA